MSPNATTIEQEGVYIGQFQKLVERGRFREKETYQLLQGAKYPARNPLQNVNDIKAQIAANEMGVRELRKMVRYFTLPVARAYMRLHVQDNAAETRAPPSSIGCTIRASAFETDQGSTITRRIAVDKKKDAKATVDFTGTSPQQGVQLQRAGAGDPRPPCSTCSASWSTMKISHECRLPAPDPHHHSKKNRC